MKKKENMVKLSRPLALIFTALLIACKVQAQDQKFQDEAELSYVETGGNSTVSTLAAKNELKHKFNEKFDAAWKIAALNSKSDGIRNAENYSTEARINYSVNSRFYTSFIAGWLKNNYTGIDSRYYFGPAAGYRILLGPKHFFHTETGLDYVSEDYRDNTDNDYLRGRVFSQYEFRFNSKNKFSQTLEYLHDFEQSDNYNIISTSALTSALNSFMSLKTSYEIRIDNLPTPNELKDKDTIFSAALVFQLI